eukprot:NODE_4_length_55019_cov_0.425091.p8 type:complete len:497 gc:universal NODE_4_length_55019_cov_0.425091:20052-18562(-)
MSVSGTDSKPEASETVAEFTHMLEKSHQLFNQLRDLSPLSVNKQWQTYFQKTFELFSRLWRFQQTHRQILNDEYRLKRYEIGEIASKIGQLYYHYYLRTSDTTYLYESKVFYDAIRDRQYFNNLFDLKNPTLVVKKLRYYCRYCIVCLLCNELDLTCQLYLELQKLIDQYSSTFQGDDSKEWILVLQEIASFTKCLQDSSVRNLKPESMRLSVANTPSTGALSESIIIGGIGSQIKCSELTVDMYRILQLLEVNKSNSSANSVANPLFPKKYLLYKPSFSTLLTYLAGAFKQAQSTIFIYISSESVLYSNDMSDNISSLFEYGLNCLDVSNHSLDKNAVDSSVLYPSDLVPFTRKPLLLMIDCQSSRKFNLPNLYRMPLLILSSPSDLPSKFKDYVKYGSLYTLFIYSPLLGFLHISNGLEAKTEVYDKISLLIGDLKQLITLRLLEYKGTEDSFVNNIEPFLKDDYLRNMIVNHLTACMIMSAHLMFANESVIIN